MSLTSNELQFYSPLEIELLLPPPTLRRIARERAVLRIAVARCFVAESEPSAALEHMQGLRLRPWREVCPNPRYLEWHRGNVFLGG